MEPAVKHKPYTLSPFLEHSETFIRIKGTLSNDNIIIEAPNESSLTVKRCNLVSIKAKNEIRTEKILAEMFNNLYANIEEKPSVFAKKSIENPSYPNDDKCRVKNIIQYYKNLPSIIKIKKKSQV